MLNLPNNQQLFSSKDGVNFLAHTDGVVPDYVSEENGFSIIGISWDERQAIENPPKSKPQLIAERRAKYQSDVSALIEPVVMAIILDGELEPVRKAAIKSQHEKLTLQLQSDVAAINSGE